MTSSIRAAKPASTQLPAAPVSSTPEPTAVAEKPVGVGGGQRRGLRTRLRRRARALCLAPGIRLSRFFFGRLPWSWTQKLGSFLGLLFWGVLRRERKFSLAHLGIAFPEMGQAQRLALGRASFRHLGTSLGELLHIWGRSPEEGSRHVDIVGFEEIERIRETGRAIVLMTGHCGNWELLSCANHSHGLNLAAMTRELDEQGLQEISVELRAFLGSEAIGRGSRASSRQMLRTLRAGGALCLLIDQDIQTDGVWVPFFDRLAYTPTAAATLALRLGAAVVPAFSERLDSGEHRITFYPPLELPDDLEEATALMTVEIEKQIRRCPEQWVWMHRRWRRRPPGEEQKQL